MTERMIENRVKKLNDLNAQIEALQKEADALKKEIQDDMTEKETDELKTANFVIRWKEVTSNRLDGKALKADLPDIYKMYCKASTCKRFTIN